MKTKHRQKQKTDEVQVRNVDCRGNRFFEAVRQIDGSFTLRIFGRSPRGRSLEIRVRVLFDDWTNAAFTLTNAWATERDSRTKQITANDETFGVKPS
jgi:hypothetical protein